MAKWNGLLSDVKMCSHCRDTKAIRLSFDVGVLLHWVGDSLLFDVVLLIPNGSHLHTHVLYREVYTVSG